MIRTRVSIAGLMWGVFLLAVGLAALKSGSDAWSAMIFLLTSGTLGLGVVGVVCDAPVARRWWVGFTVFGLGYLFLAFGLRWEDLELPPMVTDRWIVWLGGVVNSKIHAGGHEPMSEYALNAFWPFARIGHCLLALLFGATAGLLALWLFPAPERTPIPDQETPSEPTPVTPRRWMWAVWVCLGTIYAAVALLGMRTAPVFWAGLTFLLTCACLGLVALAAIFSRGRRRARRLGAFLFGAGYLILVSWYVGDPSWAEYPGDHLVASVRPYLHIIPTERRAESEGIAGANSRILKALDQPFTFKFANETALEEVLHDISTRARTDDGRPLPIYANPVELQQADRTLQSTVSLAVDGVPLRTGLHCLLEQIGLNYRIRGGLIEVVSRLTYGSDREDLEPAYEDPLLLTGHCFLALAAAGLGFLIAGIADRAPGTGGRK